LYFFIIHFNTLPPMPVSSKWPLSCITQPNTMYAPLPCFVCVVLLDLVVLLNRLTYQFQYAQSQHSGIHTPYRLVIICV
jgi:hypothetical protein